MLSAPTLPQSSSSSEDKVEGGSCFTRFAGLPSAANMNLLRESDRLVLVKLEPVGSGEGELVRLRLLRLAVGCGG